MTKFDLLSTVEQGGCSAKVPVEVLEQLVNVLPGKPPRELLVGLTTHDDAAVWQVNEETAVILTTDFFPPVCSDPFEFGQIAAANALSDVFAMGGEAVLALNIALFPASRLPVEVLGEILRGGAERVTAAGAVLAGGHTIDDYPPKYGLCVMGFVHPKNIVRNSSARPGDDLILAKPLGTGIIMAGWKVGEAQAEHYRNALASMKQLNRQVAAVMRKNRIVAGTDITGFGLLGHSLKMARESGVHVTLEVDSLPVLPGALELVDLGCIPGAAFRNGKFAEAATRGLSAIDYRRKILMLDAQTSGGMLFSCPAHKSQSVLSELRSVDFVHAARIGSVSERQADAWVSVV